MAENGYIGRAPSDSSVTIANQTNQPTGIQTTFVFNSGYDVGYLDVYVNGSRLVNALDYTATDTQNVTLTTPAQGGDVVEFVAYKAFNLTNVISETSGDLTVDGSVTATDGTFSGSVTATDGTFSGSVSAGGSFTGQGVYGTNASFTGVVTASSYRGDGSTLTGLPQQGVGIQSGGAVVGYAITTLNFIGVGNTFKVDGSTVDISIQGGGGGGGGGIGATSGISTYSLYSNQSVLSGGDYQLVNQDASGAGYNYGAFGPITVSTGSTIHVGEFDEFVII